VTITVTGLGEPAVIQTKQRTLGEALAESGIPLHTSDLVSPPLHTPLDVRQKSVAVHVLRAFPVEVIVDGRYHKHFTQAGSIKTILKEVGVELGPYDRVEPPPEWSLYPEMSLRVIRVTKATETLTMEIPYETIRREDRALSVGDQRELQAGEPGLREVVKEIILEEGKPVAEVILSDTVVKAAVNRVVAFGTSGVVSRGGRTFRYSRLLQMTATGYTAGTESNPWATGYTYTGMKATRGVVAVDPRVIPLNTRVYVEGYGFAIAADIGGAIKNMRIDLCFDTVEEALQWGVRPVTVYVLDDD
jgi:3D (Asp-Asp-Asp) domain-containing protein